jgi:hypothetical protein
MRTKTLLLSALLGALGSVAVHAQSVYSLNAVGYINVTNVPGFNMITCPLLASPDNTVGTVLNNASGALIGDNVYFYNNTTGLYSEDTALAIGSGKGKTLNPNGWQLDGTNMALPGTAFWFENRQSTNVVVTFVGTVPTGPITNALVAGFNLVGSVVPVSGDIISNSISALTNYNVGDTIYVYDPVTGYADGTYPSSTNTGKGLHLGYNGNWGGIGDPILPYDSSGFWYDNRVGTTVNWVENYSVGQ